MAVLQRILDVLGLRIASLVGGAVASRLETMVVLQQVDQQDELEQRARQLEKEGNPTLLEHLAEEEAEPKPKRRRRAPRRTRASQPEGGPGESQ